MVSTASELGARRQVIFVSLGGFDTHAGQRIGRRIEPAGLPDWMEELGDLDRLLALWEWRAGPTPWLWMVRR